MKLSSVAIMARLADSVMTKVCAGHQLKPLPVRLGGDEYRQNGYRTAGSRRLVNRKARRQGNRNASNVYQLNVASFRQRHFLNCQILTRQNLTLKI